MAIDIASQKIVGNVDFDHGVRPHCAVFGPKDGLLYVTTELDRSITVIDPKTLKIVGSIPTGQPESHMLAISHDGLRGYTANVGPGTVSVLDIKARKTLAIIPISGNTQRIAISNDDRWVFTADQTKPQMAVIDTATNTVKTWVPLDGLGYGAALTPDGRWLLMPIPRQNKVAVVDLKTMQLRRPSPSLRPAGSVVRPDGKAALCLLLRSNQVAEIDLATWKAPLHPPIATGKRPRWPRLGGNAKLRRGSRQMIGRPALPDLPVPPLLRQRCTINSHGKLSRCSPPIRRRLQRLLPGLSWLLVAGSNGGRSPRQHPDSYSGIR